MGKILQRLSLLVGLALYLFDYGSDIYVAVQYGENNEFWWFWMTIGFIGIPSIIVNITAIVQLVNYLTCIAAVLQLSIVGRYIEAFVSLEHKRIYLLAMLRYLETIMESAPQWCLQVYIMLRQWYFPSYTVVSSVFSLLSLAWSITTLEKERATHEDRGFETCETIFFLMGQLFTLISRLSAIVLFAYVFRYYVIIFLAIHWLLLVVIIFQIQRRGGESFEKSLLLSLLAAFPSLFHVSKTVIPTKNPKAEMIVGYIFIVLENIIMVTLSLTIEMPGVSHMDVLMPIAVSFLVAGSILSIICGICCTDLDDN
ncbi:XK-related 6 [Paramuricea clavata]|uniref:XK-related protein n=1 Tax=Paramuricea clavata TaxID=317549 RepID=A0A7D9KY78_PARCT|nr:XK-related 6 [Paramuricea clavata]